jgi:hypothetical protein
MLSDSSPLSFVFISLKRKKSQGPISDYREVGERVGTGESGNNFQ